MKLILFILGLAVSVDLSIQGETRDAYTVETDFLYESTSGGYVYITRNLTWGTEQVTFKFRTLDATAMEPADYIEKTVNTVVIPLNSATVSVSVSIVDDGVSDPNESLLVRLAEFSDGTGAFNSRICIADSEAIELNCRNISADENLGVMNITIMRKWPDRCGDVNMSVTIADADTFGSKGLPPGFSDFTAAQGGVDFTEAMGHIFIPDGELWGFLEVDLIDDYFKETFREPFVIDIEGDRVESCTAMGFIRDDDAPDPFHCTRRGQQCYNGDCTRNSGICDCDTGFLWPDCYLNNTTPGQTNGCDERCGTGGRCRNRYDEDGNDDIVCYCYPGYTGDRCQYSAYHMDCLQNNFGFCITPYGDFDGSIFVYGKSSVDGCYAVMVDRTNDTLNPNEIDEIPDWCEGRFLVLDYNSTFNDSPCGDFGPEEDEDGVLTYTSQLYVQYGDGGVATDEIITSYCSFDPDGVLLSSSTVYEVNADPAFLKKQTSTGTVAAATFSAKIGNNEISGPIYIDDVIKLCVSVEDANDWDCVVIKEIEVNNTKDGEDARSRVLYDEGCYNESAVFNKEPYWEVDTERACAHIWPFRFDIDANEPMFQLGIKLTARIPLDDCTEYTSCSARRKRQADEEEEASYTVILNIANRENPEAVVVEGDQTGLVTNTEPVQESSILPTIIGSVVGGTVFLVATTSILFILFRRRRSKGEDEY